MKELLILELPEKVSSALIGYAERLNTTPELLLARFAENLTGNGRETSVRKALEWYERVEFEDSLDKILQKNEHL